MTLLDGSASDRFRGSGQSSDVSFSSPPLSSPDNICLRLRDRLAYACEAAGRFAGGRVEAGESYLGRRRGRGKRGRGAGGKTIVSGVFKRGGGRVCAEAVEDASKRSLPRVTRGRVALRTVTHSDGWRGYAGLVGVGHKRHLRVRRGRDEFARGKSHINGIESFRAYAERRPAKFNAVPEHTSYVHPTGAEFRFNHRRGRPVQGAARAAPTTAALTRFRPPFWFLSPYELYRDMYMTAFQCRRTGMTLFAAGSLPFLVAAMVVASAFVLPSVFRSVFGLFVPPDVHAPDNWAVAITRMVWLFIVSGGIGVTLSGVGLWLSRRAV